VCRNKHLYTVLIERAIPVIGASRCSGSVDLSRIQKYLPEKVCMNIATMITSTKTTTITMIERQLPVASLSSSLSFICSSLEHNVAFSCGTGWRGCARTDRDRPDRRLQRLVR